MENILFGARLLPILYLKDKMVAVLVRGREGNIDGIKRHTKYGTAHKDNIGAGGFPVYCLLIIYIPNMFRFNVKRFSSFQTISKSNCIFSVCVFTYNNMYLLHGGFGQLISKYMQNSSSLLKSNLNQMRTSKKFCYSTSLSPQAYLKKKISNNTWIFFLT